MSGRVSRRDNAQHRCPRCHAHRSLCFCARIPRLETRTRLVLVIHRYEDRKPTNTGRLAAECLTHSEVRVRGHAGWPDAPFVWDGTTQPLLLFPREGAIPLGEFAGDSKPVTLIVPDGTWRQASRVHSRVPGLVDVPCVSLPAGPPSLYRLRAESHHGGLATIEAVARAMGILEGPDVRRALEEVFLAMVERTLWTRGVVSRAEVTSGLPQGVVRHDPRGVPG